MKSILHYLRIIAVVLVMGGVIYFTGEKLRNKSTVDSHFDDQHGKDQGHQSNLDHILKAEAGPFLSPQTSLLHVAQPKSGSNLRSLKTYYERRAYIGAPPVIPHEVDWEINRNQRCNICHEKGGFVSKFNAYTPITPHPEFRNCMQCHVPETEEDLFAQTDWTSVKPPNIHRPALPGSPPPIPHTLQLRENCLSCHAGPAAPLEIRTSHPERENCRQCHVPRETPFVFNRSRPELVNKKDNP